MTDAPRSVDATVADPARRYDYWLGGKDNFAVDRESGDLIAQRFPHIRTAVRQNRRFMHRAVSALCEAGIDQFLDIGTGLPTAPNTHQIAHAVNPAAKVVYVDNSPLVLAHARALLTADTGAAEVAYIDGDLRWPCSILDHPTLHETLDLTLAETRDLFTGLTIADPGVVPINRWRSDNEPEPRPSDGETAVYGGIARKGGLDVGQSE